MLTPRDLSKLAVGQCKYVLITNAEGGILNDPILLRLAENHVSDMAAMMQPGLSALLAVSARGQDATAAALALWCEFHAAREALMALVPEGGNLGPRRSA